MDYLVARDGVVTPVEVKAGASGSLRSLAQFMKEKKPRTAFRFDLNPASRQTVAAVPAKELPAYPLVSLPLYAAAVFRDIG